MAGIYEGGYEPLHSLTTEMRREERKRKKLWVHPIWTCKGLEGEFSTLYKGLVDDEIKFHEYFRMTRNTFSVLLKKMEWFIVKNDTFWRTAIIPKEILAVCLK
ncbi:hypothetical protein ANN_18925 [Periplaneta americana]|uniref:Per a allergen n=1 Tax=Periplaneta americana TaxID=6978 RepID=A0ABQ8SR62_PERAM|nr:hypothetical protein ANN_18925 [Periplaneta americana]